MFFSPVFGQEVAVVAEWLCTRFLPGAFTLYRFDSYRLHLNIFNDAVVM